MISDAETITRAAIRTRFSNLASVGKLEENTTRLFGFLAAQGVATTSEVTLAIIQAWCHAAGTRHGKLIAPSASTIRNRRWCAETVGGILADAGFDIGDWPVASGRVSVAARATNTGTRALTEPELERVQVFADPGLPGSQRAVIVALALSGGSASEIAAVTVGDVDINTKTVAFRGRAERVNPMCQWATERVEAMHTRHGKPADDAMLIGEPTGTPTAHKVSVRLYQTLRDAGLGGTPRVTGSSIRLAGAMRVLDTHGLEAAARFLGANSLDRTANALNYDWRNHH